MSSDNFSYTSYSQGDTTIMPTPPLTASTLHTPRLQNPSQNKDKGDTNDTTKGTTATSTSTATATSASTALSSSTIPSESLKETHHDSDDASSSELEEGEIDERSLPPLKKPVPILPPTSSSSSSSSSRRFRTEFSSYRPGRREKYPLEPNFEQSQRQYRPSQQTQQQFAQTQKQFPQSQQQFPQSQQQLPQSLAASFSVQYPLMRHSGPYSYAAHPQPFSSDSTPFPVSVDDNNDSRYIEAQQSLQRILELGMTYDDLLSEGLHPKFLDSLFAQIHSPSIPPLDQPLNNQNNLPESTSISPERKTHTPITATDSPSIITDVENFLHTLEPSIPQTEKHPKKRTGHGIIPIPKRRAFGLNTPKELVIDISDDDDDDDNDNDDGGKGDDDVHLERPSKPSLPPPKGEDTPLVQPSSSSRRIVKIQDRPTLKQKDVVKALRNRELAIEAMKRKIEAKMKNRGVPSNDGVVSQIAMSIVDNAGNQVDSPSVETPESTVETWLSSSPAPATATAADPAPVAAPVAVPVVPGSETVQDTRPSAITPEAAGEETASSATCSADDDDEEEQRILAELEAERQAEEKARLKRQELEDRLANARGKKIQRPTSVVSDTRRNHSGGSGGGGIGATTTTVQDNTSDDGDGECVVDAMVSEDEDQMSIVDNEDHLVKDDIAMDIVDTPIIPDPHEQLNEKHKYQSPLRIFRDFRFHPFFLSFVETRGYRSLTYFNHLNAQKTICPYELSGGICNDRHCKYQHFRTIILSDNDILQDLVNDVLGEIPTSQQNSVREELKTILSEAGLQSGNDFHTLALTIVEFRNTRFSYPSQLITFDR